MPITRLTAEATRNSQTLRNQGPVFRPLDSAGGIGNKGGAYSSTRDRTSLLSAWPDSVSLTILFNNCLLTEQRPSTYCVKTIWGALTKSFPTSAYSVRSHACIPPIELSGLMNSVFKGDGMIKCRYTNREIGSGRGSRLTLEVLYQVKASFPPALKRTRKPAL